MGDIIIIVLVVEINAINGYNEGEIFHKRRKYPKHLLSKRKKKYHFFSRYLKTKKMLPVCTSAQPIIQHDMYVREYIAPYNNADTRRRAVTYILS